MALILSRKTGQDVRLMIDEDITAAELSELIRDGITVRIAEQSASSSQVKLGFIAPRFVSIVRSELLEHEALAEV
ncbi:carbon storage regulator [Phytopseudomonas seleniipraecipitans]|uniref:Carbon storage regulator, CsrA n=1 Tax=Phytopseudomonas seleniipraecipitans TaxID=640205 RepID=A0A1G7JB17_9GAMM|nr:carbon storage regulator [Pseudomonas seleniipraecipitans]SDF22167.1 carbon storage regulator, CsrA [Pseudomonas seleniipraecipitans]